MYKFLLSDVGGEKRFAAAVARRLALLGALTQGDRRATGQSNALGLGGFDLDNKFGKRALEHMLTKIWLCNDSTLTDVPDSLFCEALKIIDSHLATVLEEVGEDGDWRDGLVPYDDDTRAMQTFCNMMESLLARPCKRLAENRIEAIKQGRNVAKYCESLQNGTETKEVIKPKIDEEVQAAKDAGLNFHALCFIWLFDVGVTRETCKAGRFRAAINVPKFLNRCLGMNLMRQTLMTNYFLDHLEKEVMSAKRAGEYDSGIETVSGNAVAIHKPRSFCFRGLEAKDDRVLLYKVAVDKGVASETAWKLYDEAKHHVDNDNNARGIKSGFYADKRTQFGFKVPRMFLIINQGKTSNKCVVVRPNEGKKIWLKHNVTNRLLNAGSRLTLCTDIDWALQKWKQEFELADVPISEKYQRFCLGRHDERVVFSGSIVPILNKLLVTANFGKLSSVGDEKLTLPSIVRVEPWGKSQQPTAEPHAEAANGEIQADDEITTVATGIERSEIPAVGHMVAREIGNIILRGVIKEVRLPIISIILPYKK